MFLIYSNIIVSVSTGLLGAGFCKMMGIDDPEIFGMFAATSTFVVYNGQRLIKSASLFSTPWLHWVSRHKLTLVVFIACSAICSLTALLYWLNISTISLILLTLVGALSIFYIQKIGGRNLRDLPALKIHIISLTWVLVIVVLPLVNGQKLENLVVIATAHYCYIVAVTIPFDIRDLKYDEPRQLTIPQLLGVKVSKIVSITLLVIFAVIMIAFLPELMESAWFYLAIVSQAVLISFMNERNGDLYCAGLIDGSIALLGISYYLTV